MSPRKFLIFRRSEIDSVAFWDAFLQQTQSYSRYGAWTLFRHAQSDSLTLRLFNDGSWSRGNVTHRLWASQTSCSAIIALLSFFFGGRYRVRLWQIRFSSLVQSALQSRAHACIWLRRYTPSTPTHRVRACVANVLQWTMVCKLLLSCTKFGIMLLPLTIRLR